MSTPLPDSLRDAVDELKPKLRGWLHAAIAPLAFFSFLVLLVLAAGFLLAMSDDRSTLPPERHSTARSSSSTVMR